MEHLSLLETNIGSKELVIISARLGQNLIADAYQASASIHIRVHSDWYFPFKSRESGNEMSADFGRIADEKLE